MTRPGLRRFDARSHAELGSDAGSAVVAIIGALAILAVVGTVAIALVTGLAVRARVEGGADLSALAAADVASGALPGVPCEQAARLAEWNAVRLERCEVDGLVATVVTSSSVLGIPVSAVARAGPPP